MRRLPVLLLTIAAFALFGQPCAAQGGGGGGSNGGGDSGGERPYGGDPFREDATRQHLAPEGVNEYDAGLRLIQKSDFSGAILHLTLAVASKPNDAHALYYLAYAHHMLGQASVTPARDNEFKMSLNYYRRSLALDGDNREAHQYLGTLYLQLNDAGAAANELKALEALCPSGCQEREALTKAIAGYQAPPK